ncbi:MAG: HAMP domain-containing sensor histidine kinase [Oscillospiraceae bacterium]
MVFVLLVGAVLIGLVWLLNVQLLEPTYVDMIENELAKIADTTAELINKHGDIYKNEGGKITFNEEFYEELNGQNMPISGKCFEIVTMNNLHLLGYEGLNEHCLLHPPGKSISFFGSSDNSDKWYTPAAMSMRAQILTGGSNKYTIEGDRPGIEQMVVARRAGDYMVIVSTGLERIGQATIVLKRQMILVVLIVLLVSIPGAYIFSRWFTKPLSKLSAAACEMAKGNYKVRVDVPGHDEIGALAEDFNLMATEVGRTAQLQRDLIANISHDLRTPLTLIKGYAETVRDLTGDNPTKRGEQLDVIIDETDRLSALVNSVMELSKYSAGTEKLNCVDFDLAQLCDEVAYKYSDICAKNSYNLQVDANEECIINADPDMMSRVVHNLLANALHHVGKDGYIGVNVHKLEGKTRVEVVDHGEGVPPQDLPYIFDKYYRTRASEGKVGTGLGLSISKAILINHGFSFGVQSALGEGSVFWFETK